MSTRKKILFYIITCLIPVVFAILAVQGYYAYRKLAWPMSYSGSYVQLDDVLGWRLKANATARYWMEDKVQGTTVFDSYIYTNVDGFRSASVGGTSPKNAVVAIGDSWTFGYAANYEDSYPGILEELSGWPVINMGIPATSSAQSLILLGTYIDQLRPRVVLHFNGGGHWARAVCHGDEKPKTILKPCYWLNPVSEKIEVVTPQPGYVKTMANRGIYPGGWLTGGNVTWSYYLISRPITRFMNILTALGLRSGQKSYHDSTTELGSKITLYELKAFAEMAKTNDFTFVMIEDTSTEDYRAAFEALRDRYPNHLQYVPKSLWKSMVDKPAIELQKKDRTLYKIPGDDHYAGPMNRLIASAIKHHIKANNLMP